MVVLSYKAKQYGWFALKVFILAVAFVFIFRKFLLVESTAWNSIFETFQLKNVPFFMLFLSFAAINWFFEIKKWQTMTVVIKKISFSEATKQSLAALTVSLVTPNRIGDYGAKAMYFEKQHRKKIVLLNFISNGFQLAVTIFFGVLGLLFIFPKLEIEISSNKLFSALLLLFTISVLGYYFRKTEWFIKGFTFKNSWDYFKSISTSVKSKVLLFSIIRYLIFSCLFFLILEFYGANSSFLETFPFIITMYLLVSAIPVFLIADVVVRGSIAIWLLTILNIPETAIIATVFAMWFLNFLLPAMVGSYYLLKFKKD